MKDLFKKKGSSKPKKNKISPTKGESRGKKFLNRFAKKKPQVAQNTTESIDAGNTVPPNDGKAHTTSGQTPTSASTQNLSGHGVSNDASLTTASASTTQWHNNTYNIQTWYSLKGRIGRVQLLAYSMIWGIVVGILLIAAMIAGLSPMVLMDSTQADSAPIISLVLLLLMIPAWIFSVIILPKRRLHDTDKSGWWLLLYFVPIGNLYLLYLLYLKSGDSGRNKYGLPPAPYSKVELILAILVPVFSLLSLGLLSIFSAQIAAMQPEVTQTQVIDVDSDVNTTDTLPVETNSAEDTLNELDPASAAQVQGAIDNAVNNPQPPEVTYAEFVREAQAKILVDKSQPPADESAIGDIFVDDQGDNQAETDTATNNNE